MKQIGAFFVALTGLLLTQGSLFAQAGEATAGKDQSFWQTIIMIGVALIFFYFILWRPEQKRRKALEKQRSSLKKGDRVTAMGIVGTIVTLKENTAILKMYDGVATIEVLKAAITDVQPSESKQAENTPAEGESR